MRPGLYIIYNTTYTILYIIIIIVMIIIIIVINKLYIYIYIYIHIYIYIYIYALPRSAVCWPSLWSRLILQGVTASPPEGGEPRTSGLEGFQWRVDREIGPSRKRRWLRQWQCQQQLWWHRHTQTSNIMYLRYYVCVCEWHMYEFIIFMQTPV